MSRAKANNPRSLKNPHHGPANPQKEKLISYLKDTLIGDVDVSNIHSEKPMKPKIGEKSSWKQLRL